MRTWGIGIVTSYYSIVLARANWHKQQPWILISPHPAFTAQCVRKIISVVAQGLNMLRYKVREMDLMLEIYRNIFSIIFTYKRMYGIIFANTKITLSYNLRCPVQDTWLSAQVKVVLICISWFCNNVDIIWWIWQFNWDDDVLSENANAQWLVAGCRENQFTCSDAFIAAM